MSFFSLWQALLETDNSITTYNRYSCPIPKKKEAKLYLMIADTQTRVFLASKMTKGYFGVYPTTSRTTVFKRYTLILPDPDTYLYLLFTILTSWFKVSLQNLLSLSDPMLLYPQACEREWREMVFNMVFIAALILCCVVEMATRFFLVTHHWMPPVFQSLFSQTIPLSFLVPFPQDQEFIPQEHGSFLLWQRYYRAKVSWVNCTF